MKTKWVLCAGTVVLLLFAPVVVADTITIHTTADNAFDLYLSTSPFSLGNLIGSGSDWTTTYTFSNVPLNAGQNNYLIFKAVNWGGPAGLLGDFAITGSNFLFANGTNHLVTNTVDWQASTVLGGSGTPTSYGTHGVGPWGIRPNIDSSAVWVWTGSIGESPYIWTEIRSTTAPEPSSLLLLGAGLGGLALSGFRRRK